MDIGTRLGFFLIFAAIFVTSQENLSMESAICSQRSADPPGYLTTIGIFCLFSILVCIFSFGCFGFLPFFLFFFPPFSFFFQFFFLPYLFILYSLLFMIHGLDSAGDGGNSEQEILHQPEELEWERIKAGWFGPHHFHLFLDHLVGDFLLIFTFLPQPFLFPLHRGGHVFRDGEFPL